MNGHLTGKELFIRFTASAFCKLLSIYVFSCFPFGFEGRMWDLIASVPDHCLSFYFTELSHAVITLGCVNIYANYLSDGLCPYDFCPCHKIGSNAF